MPRPAAKQLRLPPAGDAQVERFSTLYSFRLSTGRVGAGNGQLPRKRRFQREPQEGGAPVLVNWTHIEIALWIGHISRKRPLLKRGAGLNP